MNKVEKPYAAMNQLTGVITKRFKSSKKLAKYLYTPKKTMLGNIRPVDIFNVGIYITEETSTNVEAHLIDWTV